MRIAVDVMASDHGPAVITRGALMALSQFPDLTLVLVGDEPAICSTLDAEKVAPGRVEVLHAEQVISADEHPVEALRKKQQASLIKAVALAKEGAANAIVSAGSTGAQVAASTLMLGLLPGVKRAGIVTVMPALTGRFAMIDVGANPNCKPFHLFQYGVMCSHFAEIALGISRPRVGLLSIGSEKIKGSPLVKETLDFFESSGLDLNFVGNCEGHKIFYGGIDVVVCDGFVGNVVLKVAEGVFETTIGILKESAKETGLATNEGFRATMAKTLKRMDWTEVGGAQLLGVNGVSIIAHGRSNEAAIFGAVRTAYKLVHDNLNAHIVRALDKPVPANAEL